MTPSIGLYAIPAVVIFFGVELLYSYKEHRELYNKADTWSNVMIGLGYIFSNLVSKAITFSALHFAYQYRVFTLPGSPCIWILAFAGSDLAYYCWHRACHETGWFWASHVVHHSSEKFNLSIAFRLPWTLAFSGHFLFWLWMPLLGFSPTIVVLTININVLYQALLHTETVGRLPRPIEYFFNTPSHHRVHHSSNPEYLDKNHGGILMIWDRMFGTFAEERARPRYGLTKTTRTHNPVKLVFFEWRSLFGKAFRSGSVRHAINYFIQPPGWSHDGATKTVRQLRRDQLFTAAPCTRPGHVEQ